MNPCSPFAQPSFANPWSLRIFGVTLAAVEAGAFTLQEFQKALIENIGAFETEGQSIDSDEIYYTRWTEALTKLLTDRNLLEPARLINAEHAVRHALKALWHNHTREDEKCDPQPVFVEAAQ